MDIGKIFDEYVRRVGTGRDGEPPGNPVFFWGGIILIILAIIFSLP